MELRDYGSLSVPISPSLAMALASLLPIPTPPRYLLRSFSLWSQSFWIQMLDLPLTGCVTLGGLLYLSVLQYAYLQNKQI